MFTFRNSASSVVVVYNVTFPSITTLVVYKLCCHLTNTFRQADQETVFKTRHLF